MYCLLPQSYSYATSKQQQRAAVASVIDTIVVMKGIIEYLKSSNKPKEVQIKERFYAQNT